MFFEKDLCFILPILLIFILHIICLKRFKREIKEERKCFINTLGHDFRVAIIAQIRALELMRKNYSPELLENIKESSENTLDMITTLMETYKLENEESILLFENIRLSKMINSILSRFQPLILDKNLKTICKLDADFVYADKYYLSKALALIFTVVMCHAENGSEITIYEKLENNFSKFSLSYRGIPISDEEKSRMFRSSSNFSTVGHGMRMYLFKKIIEFHNGNVKFLKNNNINNISFSISKNLIHNQLRLAGSISSNSLNSTPFGYKLYKY